jgi:ferredoxin-like protein FixX
MNCLRYAAAVLVVLSFFSAAAAGESDAKGGDAKAAKKRILLKSIDAAYLPADDAQSLETLVCAELSRNKAFDVACPADVNALMKEQSLRMAMGACAGAECGNADRILQCDMTALAAVKDADNRYILTITLNAKESGEELAKAWVGTAANGKALADKIPAVVKDLYADLAKPRPALQPPAPAAKPPEKKEPPAKAPAEKPAQPAGQEKK